MLGVCGLFIPASSPRMINAGLSLTPDALIFDLEDAVSAEEKDSARELLRGALPLFAGRRVAVRINPFDGCWAEDMALAADPAVQVIIVPKARPEALEAADRRLEEMGSPALIAALIETAWAVENLGAIAQASPRLSSLLFGAEDYTLDMGVERTRAGEEIFYARCRLCTTAHAYGLEAVDTPFPNLGDAAAAADDARLAKRLGFDGKLAISPHHIDIIQSVFQPAAAEVAWAERVLAAMADPANQGRGAVSLDGRMIDRPILKRAERTLALSRALGRRPGEGGRREVDQ